MVGANDEMTGQPNSFNGTHDRIRFTQPGGQCLANIVYGAVFRPRRCNDGVEVLQPSPSAHTRRRRQITHLGLGRRRLGLAGELHHLVIARRHCHRKDRQELVEAESSWREARSRALDGGGGKDEMSSPGFASAATVSNRKVV